MPDSLDKIDAREVHTYITVDGEDYEIHGLGKFPIYFGSNRKQRRAKERNPRDHDKFYRKNQVRPWTD